VQTTNRIFDDLAKVANGAVTTLAGMKAEVETMIRQQVEKLFLDADLVPRDEFDAVREMAANARAEQEKLSLRVAALEAKLDAVAPKPAPKAKRAPVKPKPAKK